MMAHPDDKIVSPRAAAHGPPGRGKGKSASGGRHDRDGYDDEDDDMTIYSGIKFPPYEYREWPKWVKHPKDAGKSKICASPAEELEFLQSPLDGEEAEPSPMEKERDELAREVAELRAKLSLGDQKDAKAAAFSKGPPSPVKPAGRP